jgi:hypothetical protein
MAGKMIDDGILDEEHAIAWVMSVMKSYLKLEEPAAPPEQS